MSGVADAFIGLGANLGDARGAVEAAIRALGALPGTRLLSRSRLYRTPPWGPVPQPDYVNAVARVSTALPPLELLDHLLGIERAFGRDRSRAPHWGPRTLDLDVLLYGDAVIDEPGLRVPHPRLHERAFVVVPLHEVAPALTIPGQGALADLHAAMAGADIEALG